MTEQANKQKPMVVPVTDLKITQKHTTIVVEPTAAADNFSTEAYDSAEMMTMLWVDNPTERWVEIPLPYPTENFSDTIAVISAGPEEFSNRLKRVTRVRGNVDRFIPYLRHINVPEEILSNKQDLKEYLQGFRVGMIKIPAGKSVVRIQGTRVIERDKSDPSNKTYSFRAYAPLPSFLVPNAAPLKLLVIFKTMDTVPRTIQTPVVSNPFGPTIPETDHKSQDWCGDRFYCWTWKKDPVVDFTYKYS